MFVCNFVPCPHEDFVIGVPCDVEYKLILNSDDAKYGGTGNYIKETLVPVKKQQTEDHIRYDIPFRR